MVQLVSVKCHICVKGRTKIDRIDLKHEECCMPMAMRHDDYLAGHYRIYRPINT